MADRVRDEIGKALVERQRGNLIEYAYHLREMCEGLRDGAVYHDFDFREQMRRETQFVIMTGRVGEEKYYRRLLRFQDEMDAVCCGAAG